MELMDVESQKMSEPERTSQADTNNNQVCGCSFCFNTFPNQTPDVGSHGAPVGGVFVAMTGVLGQQDTDVCCTCFDSRLQEQTITCVMQSALHTNTLSGV